MNLTRPRSVEATPPFVQGRGFVVLLGSLTPLDPLTIDLYLPVFGDIQRSLQTSAARVELSVSTFFVGMAIGQLFYGPLADRFGRRRPLLGGMALYFMATIGCACAPGIRSFLVFRFLEALGGCAGLVITRAVVRDLFGKQRAAAFLSSMALVMGVAPVVAPSIGSLVGGLLGWRAVFLVLALANAACTASVLVLLPETGQPATTRLRLSTVVASYARLLRDRSFIGYLVPDTAIRAGMFAYIAGSSFVFIQLFHLSARQYGLVFGLNGCGLILASQANRRLLAHVSPDRILAWSVKVAALSAALVFVWTWIGAPPPIILASIFVFIATLNFVSPNSLASAMAPHGHQAGTASALYGSLQWSMATGSSFLVSSLHDGTAFPMTGVMLLCGLVSLSAFHVLVRGRALART